MAEILAQYPQLPIWLVAALLVLNLFKQPLASMLFDRFPAMAEGHFKSMAINRDDNREFAQTKELKILADKLAASEAERERQTQAQKETFSILRETIHFMQRLVDTKLAEQSDRIIVEIHALGKSVDRLAEKMNRTKTQNFLLDRLQSED